MTREEAIETLTLSILFWTLRIVILNFPLKQPEIIPQNYYVWKITPLLSFSRWYEGDLRSGRTNEQDD